MLGLSGVRAAEPTPDPARLPVASTRTGLTFEQDIRPIFERSCIKCHSGEKATARLRLDTRAGVLRGGESGEAAVVPGRSAESRLVFIAADLVPDMAMPPKRRRNQFPALTPEQLGLVRAWIDQGTR
jgi:hypothetical protein